MNVKIDSAMVQYIPRGTFYEGKDKDDQFLAVTKMWDFLFTKDRILFSLLMLLPGSSFAKGMMTRYLLAVPVKAAEKAVVKVDGLPQGFENDIISYVLRAERTPRALKNLLLLLKNNQGGKGINNARTRRLIMEFIFARSNDDLDWLSVNYRGKLKKLIRHALGKQDLDRILNGHQKLTKKYITRYNPDGMIPFAHIFGKLLPNTKGKFFRIIYQYSQLQEAAKEGKITFFKKHMKGMPLNTVMGFRNFYKLKILLAEMYDKSQLTQKQKVQSQAAGQRAGTKVEVDYSKSDAYDLLKLMYQKNETNDTKDFQTISDAFEVATRNLKQIDLGGKTNIIVDCSKSMMGAKDSKLRPMMTALITALKIKRNRMIPVGGFGKQGMIIPAGGTCLWKGLADAVTDDPDNIVVISDGYENEMKGMFNILHSHLKTTKKYTLFHFNPVLASDAKTSTRQIADGVRPLPILDPEFIETEIVFQKIAAHPEDAKKMLIQKYHNLLT
jgi:hypothetical protein